MMSCVLPALSSKSVVAALKKRPAPCWLARLLHCPNAAIRQSVLASARMLVVVEYFIIPLMSPEEVQKLADLPSREELLAQTLSAIQAPLSYLVGALQGIPRKLAGTLAALAEQKKDASE